VGNEWVIAKNGYGYHGVGANQNPSAQVNGVVVCDRHTNTTGQGHINPTGNGHTTGGTTGGVVPKVDNKKYAVVHARKYVLGVRIQPHPSLRAEGAAIQISILICCVSVISGLLRFARKDGVLNTY
jgi:hypothetical protein